MWHASLGSYSWRLSMVGCGMERVLHRYRKLLRDLKNMPGSEFFFRFLREHRLCELSQCRWVARCLGLLREEGSREARIVSTPEQIELWRTDCPSRAVFGAGLLFVVAKQGASCLRFHLGPGLGCKRRRCQRCFSHGYRSWDQREPDGRDQR